MQDASKTLDANVGTIRARLGYESPMPEPMPTSAVRSDRAEHMFPALSSAQLLGDVVVVGSSHCASTLRVREFLSRNGHPYTSLDLDRDRRAG